MGAGRKVLPAGSCSVPMPLSSSALSPTGEFGKSPQPEDESNGLGSVIGVILRNLDQCRAADGCDGVGC